MSPTIDLSGQRYGHVCVLSFIRREVRWGSPLSVFHCHCDCGVKFEAYGKLLRNGSVVSCGCAKRERARALKQPLPLAPRFWSQVNKNGPMPTVCAITFGNCWLWTGSSRTSYKQRYGRIRFEGKVVTATHAAWFLEYGVWTTNDLCHVCDVTLCVRPTHLFEGDDALNKRDRDIKKGGGLLLATSPAVHWSM